MRRSLFAEILAMSWDTLRANKLRSALTVLGIVIGVTSIVGITSLVRGFDESLRAAQDHDMAIRVAEQTRLAYIDQPVFCYRRHPDSISSRKVDVRWQNGFRILEKAAARYPYPPGIVRKRRAVLHFRMAQCRIEQRRFVQAVGHLLAALSLDPMRSLSVLSGREPVTSHH